MITKIERCVLYARLSLTTEESVSIARQLESCRKYAEARGWQILGEFVDDGVSATANRPQDRKGWRKLLAQPGFQAVVIWKVDRLARRVLDFLMVDDVLQARGAGLVAVEDPIDMTSPQGRAFAVMLAVFAELEAASISARVRAARDFIVREGRWPGGGVPYGYLTVPAPEGAGKVLAQDPERIVWLRRIASMALEGTTVNKIATWLTRCGAPLPGRPRPVTGNSPVWNRQTVDGILRNPVLAGMTPRNPGRPKSTKRADPDAVLRDDQGEPVINEALAVITVEEFRTLQQLLDLRTVPQSAKKWQRQQTSPFLSKVVRCDDCSRYMCRGTNQKKAVLYCPDCRQTISRAALDAYLIDRLLTERGTETVPGGMSLDEAWARCGHDDEARREVLLSQLDSLRVRRGVVGRYFDEDRVLLTWTPMTAGAAEPDSAPTEVAV